MQKLLFADGAHADDTADMTRAAEAACVAALVEPVHPMDASQALNVGTEMARLLGQLCIDQNKVKSYFEAHILGFSGAAATNVAA